jgi:hypothetical protein
MKETTSKDPAIVGGPAPDNSDPKIKLPEDVAKQYELSKNAVRKFFAPGLGEVDLNAVSLAQAKQLVKFGVLTAKAS